MKIKEKNTMTKTKATENESERDEVNLCLQRNNKGTNCTLPIRRYCLFGQYWLRFVIVSSFFSLSHLAFICENG